MRRGLRIIATGLLLGLVPGVARGAEPGKRLYEQHCAVCHGIAGDGRGMAAHMFRTQPRDFREGKFKFRSTPTGSLARDSDLVRSVKAGIRGTAMVPQDHISDQEIRAVVAYVKSFSERFARETPPDPIPIPAPPPKTPDLVARGKSVYKKAGCPECHGPEARGDGPSAPDLAVKPADLTRRPLKSGPTPQDLYRTLVTGLDGTPMPSYQDALEAEDFWPVVFYIDSLGGPERITDEERIGHHVEQMHQPRHGTPMH